MSDDPTTPIMQFNEVPFARRVTGTTSPTYDRSIFYERNEQLQILKNQIEGFQQAGNKEAAAGVRSQNRALVPMITMGERTQKDLGDIRKARAAITENGKMAPEAKTSRLEQLNQREQQILLRFNTRWNQVNQLRSAA